MLIRKLKDYKYQFENDTLYGSAKKVTSDPWQKFEQVKFPVSDIQSINTQEINPLLTGIAIVASGVLVVYGYNFIKNNIGVSLY